MNCITKKTQQNVLFLVYNIHIQLLDLNQKFNDALRFSLYR